MFYPPDVSLGNTFTDYPVLYVGTGDREHPLEQAVNNRIYGIVDDGTAGMDERNLTNVTSDELEPGSGITDAQRTTINTTLKNSHGWYVRLGDLAGDNHLGEKVLAQATVFYYVAYFTTYAPMDVTDTCNPLGQARVYALDYTLGTSAMDLNGDSLRNSADRFRAIGQSIPSRVKIIIRSGTAAGLISVGGSVTGAGIQGSTRLPQPSSGIQTLIWRQLSPGEIGGGSAHAPYGSYP
jgi:type IV pilus assembly protein PilY1